MSLPVVLGIDLSEQKVDATLLVDGKTKNKVCKNSTEGFEALKLWLEKQGVEKVHVCLAATDSYGEDLAAYLHRSGHMVSMVHPAIINEFAWSERIRARTDETESFLIARFCLVMKPKEWTPRLPEVRSLEDLVQRADNLINMRAQERNRISTLHESITLMINGHIAYLDEAIEKIKGELK